MKCRIGDLAIIVEDESNGGLIVQVLRPDDGRLGYDYEWDGPTWWVRSSVPLTWTVKGEGDLSATEGPYPDSCLHPIRGARAPNVQAQEPELEAS